MDKSFYIDKAKFYKNRVSSRYISVDAENINERIPRQEEYYVSTKHDGHLYFLCYEKGQLIFLNAKGKEVTDLPINKIGLEFLERKKDIDQLMLAGELYVEKEGRTRSFDLTKALTDKSEDIRFGAFDSLLVNDEITYTKPLNEIIEELEGILPSEGTLHTVEFHRVDSRNQIAELFKENVEIKEEEGVVVKTQGSIYKVKPKYTFDAVIVGYADSDGERVGMFRDLLLAFMLEDGSFQLIGHLHHGFSEEARRELLAEMSKEVVESEYIEVARNKTAFQFIKPTKVIEFSCLDVITEDSKGPIAKMNLSYSEENGYAINGKKNSVSMTIPNFIRFRTDKEVNVQDLRFSQVNEVVSFDEVQVVDENDLAPSEIIKREAYFKESKGSIMVRKFVVVKTNKEKSNKYPAYVVHTTDFSAGRKDPLKRDVKLTNSLEQAEELFTAAIEQNIKKGWERAE